MTAFDRVSKSQLTGINRLPVMPCSAPLTNMLKY